MNESDQTRSISSGFNSWINPRNKRFWLIAVVLIYTLSGFFLAPWLIERLAMRQVSELGRTLTVGEVKVNPFLLSIQVLDAKLMDSDGQKLFSYDDYFLDLQVSSLFRWAWTFKEVRLTGLDLLFERFSPGNDRFGRLIDAFPAKEDPPDTTPSKGLPRLLIHDLQINNATADVIDHLKTGNFETQVGPINVRISNLNTLPDQTGQQQVAIQTRAGGTISWQGSIDLAPFRSSGTVRIDGRIFADLDKYLAMYTSAVLKGKGENVQFDYQVEKPDDGPMTLSVTDLNAEFQDWQIFLPDDPEPLIDLPGLQIQTGALQWPAQTFDAKSIVLRDIHANLVSAADGKLNLDRLLEELSTIAGEDESDPPDSAASEQSWQVGISTFALEGASVRIRDQATDPVAEIQLENVSVQLTDVSNQPGSQLPLQASFGLASGGTGQLEAQVVVLPELSAEGTVQVDGLQLAVLQPWLNDLARLSLASGGLTMSGDVLLNPDQAGLFTGSVRVDNLELIDKRGEERLAGWSSLEIDRLEANLANQTIKTSELEFNQLFGRLQINPDKTTNLDGLMVEPGPAEETVAAADANNETTGSADFAITLAGMKFADTSMDFSDLSLPLPFAAAIRSMEGSISTLATSSQEAARVNLEGQVNEYGLARIGGSINAWSPLDFTDIQMTFRNLEMNRMTPYTIEFAGWEIAEGRMDLDLDYQIKKGQLLGANDIVIREMTVGDKVENPSGTSLPLKLAVALLKDTEGVIDVDLPVSGDLNDPQFKIGGIVLKAITNLLVKAVTAPFRLLGSLVGVDSEDFGTLHFAAGSAGISPPDREQLAKLIDAMKQRPELSLEVAGTYVPEVDRIALKTRAVDDLIEAGVDLLQAEQEALPTVQRRQVLEQLMGERLMDTDLEALKLAHTNVPAGADPEQAAAVLDETAYIEAMRQQLIDAEPVSDDDLNALGALRADAVLAFIAANDAESKLVVSRLDTVALDDTDDPEVPLELKVKVAD